MKTYTFTILLFFALVPIQVWAKYIVVDYGQAYNACSPIAHEEVRKQCRYGTVYQGYYVQCMESEGFKEEDEVTEEYYDRYMQAYRYCASISTENTKAFCNYGNVFNGYYNRCMRQYGFNEYGERIEGGGGRQQQFQFDF